MKAENEMTLTFPSRSANEAFARAAVACFAAQLDPNLEELNDIKTAVSEAVTNCIVHAYRDTIGLVTIRCRYIATAVVNLFFGALCARFGRKRLIAAGFSCLIASMLL